MQEHGEEQICRHDSVCLLPPHHCHHHPQHPHRHHEQHSCKTLLKEGFILNTRVGLDFVTIQNRILNEFLILIKVSDFILNQFVLVI